MTDTLPAVRAFTSQTGRTPTSDEPLSDFPVPRAERRFTAQFPEIGYRGWSPSESRSTTPDPSLGTPAPPCYRRRRRVPDDASAPPRRSRP